MRIAGKVKDIFLWRHCRDEIDVAGIVIVNRGVYAVSHAITNNSCPERVKPPIRFYVPFREIFRIKAKFCIEVACHHFAYLKPLQQFAVASLVKGG